MAYFQVSAARAENYADNWHISMTLFDTPPIQDKSAVVSRSSMTLGQAPLSTDTLIVPDVWNVDHD